MRPTCWPKWVARPLLCATACALIAGCGSQAAVSDVDSNPAAQIQEEVRPPSKPAAKPGAGKPVVSKS